jgi:hypothetical protein
MQFLIFCFVLLSSCEYQPTGYEFTNLDSNFKSPEITIELPNENTAISIQSNYIYNLKYKLGGNISRFKKVIFFRDTNIIYQSSASANSFKIQIKIDEPFRTFKLKMLIFNSSGTGSLAEKLDLEGTVSSKEWFLEVYNMDFFKADSIGYEVVNGSLQINWKLFPFPNFVKYEITKEISGDYGKTYYLDTITDKDQNYYLDKNYLCEDATYRVRLYFKSDNYIEYLDYPKLNKEKELPEVTIKKISNNSFEFNWKRSKFFNNINGYLFTNSKIMSDVIVDGPNTESITIQNLPLGINDKLKFLLLPKNSTLSLSELNQKNRFNLLALRTGDSSFTFSEIESGQNGNIFYTQNINWYKYTLLKYSTQSNKILQKVDFETTTSDDDRICSSPSGKHIIYKNGISVAYCLDGDLNNMKSLTDVQLTGNSSDYGFEKLSISDNGILAAYFHKYMDNTIYIYNLYSDNLICKINFGYIDISGFEISALGNYIVINIIDEEFKTKIYNISSQTPELIKDDLLAINLTFDPDNNDRLIYYEYNKKQILSLDCSTKSVSSLGLDTYYYYNIDFKNAQILVSNKTGEYEIRDLNNVTNLIYKYNSINGSGFIKDNMIYFGTGVKCSY